MKLIMYFVLFPDLQLKEGHVLHIGMKADIIFEVMLKVAPDVFTKLGNTENRIKYVAGSGGMILLSSASLQ